MHPLDGPRAKVNRAESQLVTLQKITQDFFEINRYTVVLAEFDRKTGGQNIRISNCPKLPDEWGVIIGEIAHNLRSALDALAWQLALLNTTNPDNRTGFPIYIIGRTNRRLATGDPIPQFWHNGHGLRRLQSINRRYWTRIEAFQPYKRGNGYRQSPLFLLHELNNTDKHRLISVLTPIMAGFTFSGIIGGGSKFNKRTPLYPNAKVGCVMPLHKGGVPTLGFTDDGKPKIVMREEVEVNFDITPGIRFGNSCDAVKGLPIIRTLHRISNEVSRIIESFAGEFPIR